MASACMNVPGSATAGTVDEAGRNLEFTVFGDNTVTTRTADIALRFTYGINTYDMQATTSGTGTATTANDLLILQTGTTAGSSAVLQSLNYILYRPGYESYCYVTTIFTVTGTPGNQVGVVGCNQYIGAYDTSNGFAVGFQGGSTFGVIWRVSGVDTFIPQSQFTADQLNGTGPSGVTIDFTKLNLWKITYGWLGASPINFEFMSPSGAWYLFNRITVPNQYARVSIHNPTLTGRAEVTSTTSTTNVTLQASCIDGGEALLLESPAAYRFFTAASNAAVTLSATLIPMVSIQSATTYNGTTNKVVAQVLNYVGASSNTANALVEYQVLLNPILTGASFSSVSTNSVMSVDVSATAVSGGTLRATGHLGANNTLVYPVALGQVTVLPGQILTIAASSAGGSKGAVSLNWQELF